MNEGRCDERLKLELRNLYVSHTLGCQVKICTQNWVVYYKRVKREVKRVYRNGCRCNERLNTEQEDLKRLSHTGLHG